MVNKNERGEDKAKSLNCLIILIKIACFCNEPMAQFPKPVCRPAHISSPAFLVLPKAKYICVLFARFGLIRSLIAD